jgi:hypothetical protein
MKMLPAWAVKIVFGEAVCPIAGYDIGGVRLNQTGIETREAVDQRGKCLFEIVIVFAANSFDGRIGFIQ